MRPSEAARWTKVGKVQAACLSQIHRAAEVALHGLADGLADRVLVLAHEGMEHEGHMTLTGMPGLPPGHAVLPDLVRQFLEGLAEEMGEDAASQPPGLDEGVGIAGRREPHRQFGLDRPGHRADLHDLAQRVGERQALAAPEAADVIDLPRHLVLALGEALGRQDEVVRGCHPDAKAIPARPFDRLSIIAQSSATRRGWCSGRTQLPARILTRSVQAARAAALRAALG